MVVTGRIAAEQQSFNGIRQVAPICTHLIHGSRHGSLGLNESAPNQLAIGSAVFAHRLHHCDKDTEDASCDI